MRCASRGKGNGYAITEDRIKGLNQLGFEWGDMYMPFQVLERCVDIVSGLHLLVFHKTIAFEGSRRVHS